MRTKKPVKCAICKTEYIKRNISHKVCSVKCSIEYIELNKQKENRKDYIRRKKELLTLSDYRKLAQAAVNTWVRYRDRGLGCISCDKPATWSGQWHAGHYRSRGSCPELALDELNIFRQCSQCNNFLSGNQAQMRQGIIDRYGQQRIDYLESNHAPAKLNKADLESIAAEYRARIRMERQKARDRLVAGGT